MLPGRVHPLSPPLPILGRCDLRFERVREQFAREFAAGNEVGAAVCVTLEGETVVDLWGGHRDRQRTLPWERDTLANVYSTPKGAPARRRGRRRPRCAGRPLLAGVRAGGQAAHPGAPAPLPRGGARRRPQAAAEGRPLRLATHVRGPRGAGALVGARHAARLPRADLRLARRRGDPPRAREERRAGGARRDRAPARRRVRDRLRPRSRRAGGAAAPGPDPRRTRRAPRLRHPAGRDGGAGGPPGAGLREPAGPRRGVGELAGVARGGDPGRERAHERAFAGSHLRPARERGHRLRRAPALGGGGRAGARRAGGRKRRGPSAADSDRPRLLPLERLRAARAEPRSLRPRRRRRLARRGRPRAPPLLRLRDEPDAPGALARRPAAAPPARGGLRMPVKGSGGEPPLRELAARGRCAVVSMELQRGVVGDLACIPELAKAVAEAGVIDRTARLLRAARRAGVRVIHCTAAFRRDRAGSPGNVPLVNRLLQNPEHLVEGSPACEVVPELGPEREDLVSQRLHGMSPFTGTSLDPWLRSEGATTVIATGVSLNVGITGLVIEAVNRCYRVVVARDCVAGWPLEYGELVLEKTIAQLATLATADEIAAVWAR